MNRIFTILFSLFFVTSLSAAPITLDQARKAALSFLNNQSTKTKSSSQDLQLVWSDHQMITKSGTAITSPTFYVFNASDNKGFVAIAGDDDAYPILGFSLESSFVKENMPSVIQNWFMNYQSQIEWIRDNSYASSSEVKEAWRALSANSYAVDTTGQVIYETALWDQMTPYNNLCPVINSQKTPTGCVATSTAIVMKYHAWPLQGTGSHSYTLENYGTLSANFNTTFDWANMPLKYVANQYTAQQASNVATLMYDIGVFSEMDYAPGESGANTLISAAGLVKYMSYDIGLQVLSRKNYDYITWVKMLTNELDNGRIVIYAGDDDSGTTVEGHQFILDGYLPSLLFHVNWGWSGVDNGYFVLSLLNPANQGVGGNVGGFSEDQQAVIGIQKPQPNAVYNDVLAFFDGDSQSGTEFSGIRTSVASIQQNVPFTVIAGYIGNLSIRSFSGTVAVALTGSDGTLKQFVSTNKSLTLPINQGIASQFDCNITQAISAGDQLRMMYKSSDSDTWQWVRGGGDCNGYILLSNPTSNEEIAQPDEVSIVCSALSGIEVVSQKPIKEVRIYTLTGQLVKKMNDSSNTILSIPTDSFNKGVYIIEVSLENSKKVEKIIIR